MEALLRYNVIDLGSLDLYMSRHISVIRLPLAMDFSVQLVRKHSLVRVFVQARALCGARIEHT